MLNIARVTTDSDGVTYALSGEITADQMKRLKALIRTATKRRRPITFDLQRVWRVDREAAALIGRHACRPNDTVRVVGLPRGLFEWLRTVRDAQPRTSNTARSARRRE